MLSINTHNNTVFFRDIKTEHLPRILDWYNKIDDFKFATGIDAPISMGILMGKLAEVRISSEEFFVGIHLRQSEMIGVLKGRVQNRIRSTAWINSIVIDPLYQKKGYGSSAIELLLWYLSTQKGTQTVLLSVIEENTAGVEFWSKNGFQKIRRIENHIILQDKGQNVIIMQKTLM